jgi:methylated-DNA-protein-cysteine methyltransferase-like protein
MDRDLLQRIWTEVARIPRGSVLSYGVVATRAGLPGRARQVGRALGAAPAGMRLPWHRVTGAGGRLALPAGSPADLEQRRRLMREGLEICGRRVLVPRAAGVDPLDRELWGEPRPPPRRR